MHCALSFYCLSLIGLLGKVVAFSSLRRNFISATRSFGLSNKLIASLKMSTETCAAPVAPVEYFRADYKPCDYVTTDIYLKFKLSQASTEVVTTSKIFLNPKLPKSSLVGKDLILNGEELKLESVKVNGNTVSSDNFKVDNQTLAIFGSYLESYFKSSSTVSEPFIELETTVHISPEKNLALSGLYKSGTSLCTQCEAMGFRRIAFHQDRPDILSRYKVYMEGDKTQFPILLSNGNQLETGICTDNPIHHWAIWEDPFPKPSYLFALVAGDFGSLHDTYTTTSGRVVKLGIFSEKKHIHRLDHAMYSLKRSMKWDEDTFGLECDLDIYNIVATDDFNMGAMENKGLNVFNSAYVLADSKTATDTDYERILGVIGHEYFHNWSGNRVTVRDWFQLTLKEGLTVFRDQWFSSDETSHAVKRVEDVRVLRSRQFAEDQGPMAHPIRPESYISMDNFYTMTVYNKGAEIVRMYRTLLGDDGFKKGMKLYFERHDGSAVTCDDFRAAMADANNADLTQFERWYSQAGTPLLYVEEEYNAESSTYKLKLRQFTPDTPNQPASTKKPLLIPVVVGLLSRASGKEIVSNTVLKLSEMEQTFEFNNVKEIPLLSILRDFSAPVKLMYERSEDDLAFLMAHDTDSFNKWDAADKLSTSVIMSLTKKDTLEDIQKTELPSSYVEAVRTLLKSALTGKYDYSLVAYALQLPDESTLMQEMIPTIYIDHLHTARGHVKKSLAILLKAEFEQVYQSLSHNVEYQFTPQEVARRRLKNTCLDFLSSVTDQSSLSRSKTQYDTANCMTDRISALGSLVSKSGYIERDQALSHFYDFANHDPLMLNKWFSIQAMADSSDLIQQVKTLKKHPDFAISNPNRVRSLISVFAGNYKYFHDISGEGYSFVAENVIELDSLNPQVAARMASAFSQWKRFDTQRQELMKKELQRIQATSGLSKDTFEVVSRCLK